MHEQSSGPHSPRVKPLQPAQTFPGQQPQCQSPAVASLQPRPCCSWCQQESPTKHPLAVPTAAPAGQSVPSQAAQHSWIQLLDSLHCFAESVTSQTQRSHISLSYLSNPQGEWSSRGRHSTKPSMFHFLACSTPPQTLCPKFQPLCLAAAPSSGLHCRAKGLNTHSIFQQ